MSSLRFTHWMLWLAFVTVSVGPLCLGPLCLGPLWADDPEVDSQTKTLLEQLTSPDVPSQDSAIQSLEHKDLDATAIPLLMTAAESDNLKGQHAAFKLLVRLAKPDNALGQSARAALTELSKSKKPQVVAAAIQALRVLEPAVDPPAQPDLPLGLRAFPRRAMPARAFETVMTTTFNGERQIHVRNQDRKLEIKDRDGKEIEIKVTETAGGKETTYTAKDVGDLKQKHADILPLYEKYTQPKKGLPAGNGGWLPVMPPGFNIPVAGGNTAEAHKQIENSLGRLAKVKEALEAMDKETFDKEKVKELLKELEAAKKELFAAQAQLGMP